MVTANVVERGHGCRVDNPGERPTVDAIVSDTQIIFIRWPVGSVDGDDEE